MPCENCVNRRDFLSTAAGVAGLTVLASCGDGHIMALAPPTFAGEFDTITVTVADFPALANTGILVTIPGRSFAVKRTGSTTFAAFSTRCTHQGCIVNITNGLQFDCPCHFSRFSNDGAVIRGPAESPLPTFATSYNPATDQLTIS